MPARLALAHSRAFASLAAIIPDVGPTLTAPDSTLSAYEADPIDMDVIGAATYTGVGTITISAANATLGVVSIETDSAGSVTGTSGRQYLLYTAADYDTGTADTITYTLTDGTVSASAEVAVTVKAFSVAYSGDDPTIDVDDENTTATIEVTGNSYHSGPVVITLADLDAGPVSAYAPVAYDANAGDVEDGDTISAEPGVWVGDVDDGTITVAGQWQSDGVDIDGEISTSLTVDLTEYGGTSLTYVETASDSAGNRTATSNPISVPSSAPLWTPSNLATAPTGWYDVSDDDSLTASSGDSISRISPQGAGFDLVAQSAAFEMTRVASDPNFQNRQVLVPKLDWATSEATVAKGYVAADLISTRAMFIVTQFVDGSDAQFTTDFACLAANNDVSAPRIFGESGTSRWLATGRFDDAARIQNGVTIGPTGDVLPMPASVLYFEKASASPILWSFWFNGFADNRPWSGPLAEILLLDYVPTTDQRQRIEGYLAHKWGFAPSLRNTGGTDDHPYKTSAPTV